MSWKALYWIACVAWLFYFGLSTLGSLFADDYQPLWGVLLTWMPILAVGAWLFRPALRRTVPLFIYGPAVLILTSLFYVLWRDDSLIPIKVEDLPGSYTNSYGYTFDLYENGQAKFTGENGKTATGNWMFNDSVEVTTCPETGSCHTSTMSAYRDNRLIVLRIDEYDEDNYIKAD